MMGERTVSQEALLYSFSLEWHVPADHLLRSIDRFVDLSDTHSLHRCYNTTAKIVRIGPYPDWPPKPSQKLESENQPKGNPPIQSDRFRVYQIGEFANHRFGPGKFPLGRAIKGHAQACRMEIIFCAATGRT